MCRFYVQVQWNDFSEVTSVAESHGFNIIFYIFPTTVDDREHLGEFPIHFIFFEWAKMGDNYEIWRETGQLASCCTSIYSFLSIWFTDSLNICKILFSEISDTLIISFSVLMKIK